MDLVLGFPGIARYIFAFLILFPIGFLMGFPFPMGMRYLLENPVQRAYAWALNGCSSVLTSIISAQIALSLGITHIMAFAAIAYLFAFLSVRQRQR